MLLDENDKESIKNNKAKKNNNYFDKFLIKKKN